MLPLFGTEYYYLQGTCVDVHRHEQSTRQPQLLLPRTFPRGVLAAGMEKEPQSIVAGHLVACYLRFC